MIVLDILVKDKAKNDFEKFFDTLKSKNELNISLICGRYLINNDFGLPDNFFVPHIRYDGSEKVKEKIIRKLRLK